MRRGRGALADPPSFGARARQPFELDYFQVILTLCDMLEETYQKIQSYLGPPVTAAGGFPQPPGSTSSGALGDKGGGLNPQLVEAATKADAKLKVSAVLVLSSMRWSACGWGVAC